MLRPLLRRIACSTVAVGACLLLVACAGNPTYFPYLLPGGVATRTHPKPAGIGYFEDYDPHACRVELRPDACHAPVRGMQVFIATVYDADGLPRRNRRVEWIIEGPGNLVEVDESGYTHGRGMKVDNKYGFSHTDYLEHCFDRGNKDPSDDFTVGPGQTWCVVTSAVEGETTVTAYVPAINDWNKNRAISRLSWVDASLKFPTPVTAKAGTEHTFDTMVKKGTEAAAGFQVRYRIVDGPPAALVSSKGERVDSVTEAVAAVGSDGNGRMNITQPAAATGTNRIAIEVVKPNPEAPGQFTLVSKGETKITWQAAAPPAPMKEAKLSLSLEGPASGAVGEKITYKAKLTNNGDGAAEGVRVQLRLDEGLELDDPQGSLDVSVGRLGAGQTRTINLPLKARQNGRYTVMASATGEGDLVADPQSATVDVGESGITVTAHGPAKVFVGQEALIQLVVRNTGDKPLDRVVARVTLPPEMRFVKATDGGKLSGKQVVWDFGSTPASAERDFAVSVVCEKSAKAAAVNATVSASDGERRQRLEKSTFANVEIVGVPALQISVKDGMDPVAVGQRTTYTIRVKNAGTQTATNVEVTATVPTLMKALRGTGPGAGAKIEQQTVTFPAMATLAPNAETTFVVEVEGSIPGEGRFSAEVKSPNLSQPIRADEPTRIMGRESLPKGGF